MALIRSHPALSVASVIALVAVLLALAPPSSAEAEADADADTSTLRVVQVGADDPGSPPIPSKADRFEYHAYYPSTLQVHRGDVVRFDFESEHSVTFFPGGVRPRAVLVPDEQEGDVRVDGVFPSHDDCALGTRWAELPPCVLSDTDTLLNTGASGPNPDYKGVIAVDLAPGTYAYYCVFHPAMRGEIEVVADDEEVLTPAEVEQQVAAEVARDTANAEAVINGHQAPPPQVVGDHLRWEVTVGGSTPDGRVGILQYLPADLEIAPGDEVEFVVPDAANGFIDGHSVSFLPDAVKAISPLHLLEVRCDLDGRDEGASGVPLVGLPALVTLGDCPEGELEMLYLPHAYEQPAHSPGGVVAGPQPQHDSGILAGDTLGDCFDRCDPWTGEPFPSRFDAVFPAAGSYEYWCFLHVGRGMVGGVTVSPSPTLR